eukprot:NODE_167_length_16327_cov_0.361597.p5 type:complete len:201 gc:universal NODE_167_length_16327_cov_0.361597:11239-11841(+)
MQSDKRKILWGFSGSVATIKYDEIRSRFPNDQVFVLTTTNAKHFANFEYLKSIKDVVRLMKSQDPFWIAINDSVEWEWREKNDLVLHIELKKWADLFVLIPCSANTLAKVTNGICDSLLLNVARAWDFHMPFIICPCMNTQMYNHPVTAAQIQMFLNWNGKVIYPVEKLLACGDYGTGALPSLSLLVDKINNLNEQNVPN